MLGYCCELLLPKNAARSYATHFSSCNGRWLLIFVRFLFFHPYLAFTLTLTSLPTWLHPDFTPTLNLQRYFLTCIFLELVWIVRYMFGVYRIYHLLRNWKKLMIKRSVRWQPTIISYLPEVLIL